MSEDGQLKPQLARALWPAAGMRVHALIDAAAVPDLTQTLATAECAGWDCLQRGALSPADGARAAYIAELLPEAGFTRWLLQDIGAAIAVWGCLATSRQSMLVMREHFRELAEVDLPDHSRRAWRWWDAGLLNSLLPTLSPPQLDAFFAPGHQLVAPAAGGWTWWQRRDGVLDRQDRAFA